MANKYCNLKGYNKVSDEYSLITTGFDGVDTDVKALQTEVGEIVKGDANAEVGQAHISDAKSKVFPTIKDRFEEIEEDVSVNVLNTTLALSTADSIKSVTANVGSVPKVKIVAPDIRQNLLPDGGEDISKWQIKTAIEDTAQKMFGSKSFKCFTSASNPAYVASDISDSGTNYYFASMYVYVLINDAANISISISSKGAWAPPNYGTKSADKNKLNVWQRIGFKFSTTDGFRILYGRSGAGLTEAYIDGLIVERISQEDYNSKTEEQLLLKLPFINSVQPLLNPCLTVRGKNLLDKSEVTKGKFIVLADGTISTNALYGYVFIKIESNKQYKLNKFLSSNTAWFATKGNTAYISRFSDTNIAPSNAKYLGITLLLTDLDTAQLEEGTVATSHETPWEKQRIYPCTLGKVSTYADELTDDGIKAVKTWRVKKYVLQASNISSLNTGEANVDYVLLTSEFFKKIGGNIALPTESKAIVGDYIGVGYSTGTWNALTNPHHFSISGADGRMAFIFPKGTYANLAAAQAALTGTEIWYVLAQEEQEIIEPVGSLKLEQGYNCVDVSTGIAYERANPQLYNSGGTDYYFINIDPVPLGNLKYKNKRIVKVYRDGTDITSLCDIATISTINGKERIRINKTDYDPNINVITVLYEVLQEDYNSQQVQVKLEYADNLRSSHNQLVENVSGIENELGEEQFARIVHEDMLVTGGNGIHGLKIEEGIWAPTLIGQTTAGSNTYTKKYGKYYKNGKHVIAEFKITLSAKDANMNGNVILNGLPFSPAPESTGAITIGYIANIVFPTGVTQLAGRLYPGSSNGYFYFGGNNTSAITLTAEHLTNTTVLEGVVTYITK
jgi:hypothetical protein